MQNLFILIYLLFSSFFHFETVYADEKALCQDNIKNTNLIAGWYLWEPYQYNQVSAQGYELVGMDIELLQQIAKNVDMSVKYTPVSWAQHQLDLKNGVRDVASGATYTEERAKYAYFSVPYRFEENSLFMRQDSDKILSFNNITEFLSQLRLQNFSLGVTRGFIYADPQINLFIADESNHDIIVQFNNDAESFEALRNGDIDGFISDRIVGASNILHSKKGKVEFREISLGIKTPIHIMFSKKSVPVSVVNKFNDEIKYFIKTTEHKEIIKAYLYPVMLLQTIDSRWFYLIGVIGTIAFAVSGVAIAAKDNATLFGTFLFAMLPSVGGGIMRDVLVNREKVGIFLTQSYMYYILIVVIIGFSTVRLLQFYNKDAEEDSLILKFWNNILVICDALGQAAFVATGVSIVIMARIEPIELWGPFFAFLTANGGGILRDLLRKQHQIICLTGTINAEVAVIWGFLFGLYLDINSYNPDPAEIKNAVILVVIGAFATRLVAYYFDIPNIKFRAEIAKSELKKENEMP